MGVVYEAQDPQIGRVVAIKVLRQDRAGDEALVQRFLREAKAIGRLSHPRIVTIYDAAEDRGIVYIAMEFVQGRPLKDVLHERRLTMEEILDIGAQVADALHYAHEKGVVHRDIKPSNIILQPDGQIKITDFGIARIEGSTATLQTQAGETMGTPAYMSPEQVLGKPVDRRTDLFSLGVILYELSTGNRPFGGPGATLATIFKEIVQNAPVVPASAALPGAVSPGVSSVIMKCLKKSSDERYQTGLELADALRREIGRQEKKAAPSPGSSASGEPVRPTISAVTVLVGTVLAVGAIAAGLGVFRYSTRAGTKPPAAAAKPASTPPTPPTPQTRPQVHAVAPQSLPTSAVRRPGDLPSGPTERRPPQPRPTHAEESSGRERPLARVVTPAPVAQRPTASIDLTVPSTPLKVISIPEGASISIDGRTVGRAPATFMVSVGRHRLHATHAGSRDAETEVDVRETMEYPIRLFLEPAQ
ncbi:MAG: protein kinase [Deltaproteobacteria bacterium]|nr:protein kinase [Deltaproteobacteria bacterium]